MTTYCQGCKQAQIKLSFSDGNKQGIQSDNPPVEINIIEIPKSVVDYTHQMDQPLNITFNQPISDIVLNDLVNQWKYDPGSPPCSCPTLSTVGFQDSLHILGNRLYSDFDPPTPQYPNSYSGNTGSCSYKIYFGGCQVKIFDTKTTFLDKIYRNGCPKCEVNCDNQCPDGYLKCEISAYPGYCCISCNEIKRELSYMRSIARGVNG